MKNFENEDLNKAWNIMHRALNKVFCIDGLIMKRLDRTAPMLMMRADGRGFACLVEIAEAEDVREPEKNDDIVKS